MQFDFEVPKILESSEVGILKSKVKPERIESLHSSQKSRHYLSMKVCTYLEPKPIR